MKKLRVIKVGFVWLIFMLTSTLTYGQVAEKQNDQNIEIGEKNNIKNIAENDTIKLKVNTNLIEQHYGVAEFWNAYKTSNVEENNLEEINEKSKKRYKKITLAENSNETLQSNLDVKNEKHENIVAQTIH